MAERTKSRAWLFALYERVNLAGPHARVGQMFRWTLTSSGGRPKRNDIAFVWEPGDVGGLRGVLRVQSEVRVLKSDGEQQVWDTDVEVLNWTEPPVAQALMSGLLAAKELSARRGEDAIGLETSDAILLYSFLAPNDDVPRWLEGLDGHFFEESVRSVRGLAADVMRHRRTLPVPEDAVQGHYADAHVDFWNQSSRRQGVSEAVDAILSAADYQKQGVSGPTSTTRIFLSVFVGAEWAAHSGMAEDERVAAAAISVVRQRFGAQLRAMAAQYRSEVKPTASQGRQVFTAAAAELLNQARNFSRQKTKGMTSADGLALAILTAKDGRFIERLERVGLQLAELRGAFLRAGETGGSKSARRWSKAFDAVGASYPPRKRPSEFRVPQLGNDNAWQAGQPDMLGADSEARAFAALAISPRFVPPLAVGLFGNWGSGKSFFMRLVFEHIERLSSSRHSEGENAALLKDVVQVKFNAWHYVDSNLWASLVDHIFTELDKATSAKEKGASDALFEQLTTARELTLESAERLILRRKEQEEAATAFADAEQRLALTEASLGKSPRLYWEAVKDRFLGAIEDPERKKALADAAETLGLPDLLANGRELSETLEGLDEERKRSGLMLRGVRSQLGSWQAVLLLLGLCLGVPVALQAVQTVVSEVFHMPWFMQAWSQATVTTTTILSSVAAVVAVARGRVRAALGVLQSVRKAFDSAAEMVLKAPKAEIAEKQRELARLSAEVEEGRARLAASTERLSAAANEYNSSTGKGRLLSFVRSKAASREYAQHLGLVAAIRKDFEELSALISSATNGSEENGPELERDRAVYAARVDALVEDALSDGANFLRKEEVEKLRASKAAQPDDARKGMSRIVLYIDDLDRCQPEKVAEVLQAVHLLLSFRLFVVFVAVDVRWVSKALVEAYPSLLANEPGAHSATAHDYLEKIFQVPYWVRPMNEQSSSRFMAERLRRQKVAIDQELVERSAEEERARATGSVTQVVESGDRDIEHIHPKNADFANVAIDPKNFVRLHPAANEPPPHIDLSDEEGAFITELAQWSGGSPRRLIRFLNVYQVMKASLHEDDAHVDVRDSYELMTQVAIVTGAPESLPSWLKLLASSPKEVLVTDIVALAEVNVDGPTYQRRNLIGALKVLGMHHPYCSAESLMTKAILSQRFSFGSDACVGNLGKADAVRDEATQSMPR